MFGKTGTTSGPTNVWFVGGSPQVVAGVYMGFDRPRPMGGYAQGGTLAAPIFRQFARTAFEGMPMIPFRAPPGIRMVRIDRALGPAGVRRLAERQRPARRGDLGSVQARERAAPNRRPRAESTWPPPPRQGPASTAAPADRARQRFLAKTGRDLLGLRRNVAGRVPAKAGTPRPA